MSVFTSLSLCFFHSLPQSLLLTPPRIRILSRLLSHVMHEVRSGVPCDSLTGSKAYMAAAIAQGTCCPRGFPGTLPSKSRVGPGVLNF